MRILHFGTFDRDVGRNAIVADALRAAGVEIVECHVPLWRDTDDKLRAVRRAGGVEAGRNRIAGVVGLSVTVARLIVAEWKLMRRARALRRTAGPIHAVFVGSTGHLDMPLARLIADQLGAALVFDPLVSIGETVRDRGLIPPNGIRMRALNLIERRLFALADHVLVDTAAHAAALEHEVGLDPSRVSIVPAGAPALIAEIVGVYQGRSAKAEPLRIVYAGQYIPLHGIEIVLHAADRLRDRADLYFELVGVGQMLAAAKALAADLALPNVRFIETWMPVERLARDHLATADICLGIFGDQPKARLVVPFKVYAALAAGRPVITADTQAVRELLAVEGAMPAEVEIVPASDPAALAEAIRALADDPARRRIMAYTGRAAWASRFSPAVLGNSLVAALELAVNRSDPPRLEGPRHRWRTEHLAREVLAAAPAGRLLDAGCGNGTLVVKLASLRYAGDEAPTALSANASSTLVVPASPDGYSSDAVAAEPAPRVVFGFDRDRDRVRTARRRAWNAGTGDRTHLFVADVTAIPLRSCDFVGATAGEVLEHVADDRAAAAEIARILSSSGVLVTTVPAGAERLGAVDRMVGHVRRYDRPGIESLLVNAGFAVEISVGSGILFGRFYDNFIQRPAVFTAAHIPRTANALSRLARSEILSAPPKVLFAIDSRLESTGFLRRSRGTTASGWMIRARRIGP